MEFSEQLEQQHIWFLEGARRHALFVFNDAGITPTKDQLDNNLRMFLKRNGWSKHIIEYYLAKDF